MAKTKQPTASHPQALSVGERETLQQLCQRLNLHTWDVLIIGDGSGTTWDRASGWACVLIDRYLSARRDFCGGVSLGSINFAELMPYFQALLWYDHFYQAAWKARQSFLRVTILTDHKALVDQATQAADDKRPLPAAQEPLWAAFRQLLRMGYLITFVWQPRDTSDINRACDILSKDCRKTVEAVRDNLDKQRWVDPASKADTNIYDINPLVKPG